MIGRTHRIGETLLQLSGHDLWLDVMDGGSEFERLEWLGDSILDALVIRHVVLAANPVTPMSVLERRHSRLVRDDTLMSAAASLGLAKVGQTPRSDARHRQGDSIEAWIGAAFLHRGWPGAAEATSSLLLAEIDPAVLVRRAKPPRSLLSSNAPTGHLAEAVGHEFFNQDWLRLVVTPVSWRRRLVPVGAKVLEAAHTIALFDAHPDASEGTLSALRAQRSTHATTAQIARERGVSAPGWRTSDRLLLALLGAVSFDAGPKVAEATAAALLAPVSLMSPTDVITR